MSVGASVLVLVLGVSSVGVSPQVRLRPNGAHADCSSKDKTQQVFQKHAGEADEGVRQGEQVLQDG